MHNFKKLEEYLQNLYIYGKIKMEKYARKGCWVNGEINKLSKINLGNRKIL